MPKVFNKQAFPAVLLAFFIASTAGASQTPDELVQIAWDANPGLTALQANIEAAKQKILQSGAWKDPVVAVEYSNVPVDSFELGDHAMSGVQLRIQQTFPFPGKTSKRRESAGFSAVAASFEYQEKRNRLRLMIKTAYWQLAESRVLEKMIVEQIDQVKKLVVSVKSRYEVGATAQHELLKLEVLKSRLEDEAADFHRRDVELTAAINAMLHRLPDTPVETPDEIKVIAPVASSDVYIDKAKSSNPALMRLTEISRAGRAAARRARYEAWPDPTIWAGYRIREEVKNDQGMVMDEGVDFASVGLSVPIPFSYSKGWGAAKQESLASSHAAESLRLALFDEIQGDIMGTLAAWRRARKKHAHYRDKILPAQMQTIKAARAAYEVGRANFSSLYDAQIALIDMRRTIIGAAARTRILEAKMESLVGEGLAGEGGES